MPYLFLAGLYDELATLTKLIDRIELRSASADHLAEAAVFAKEVARIKHAAARDVLIFPDAGHHYIRHHILNVGSLLIRVKDLNYELHHQLMMTAEDRLRSELYYQLSDSLKELFDFYNNLGNKSIV
jgi:hypothetical protein